jgi:hypothetical protein
MFVMTKSALLAAAQAYVTSILSGGVSLHLFKTNVTPTPESTIATFTEADFTGYSSVAMTGYNPAYWQTQGAAIAFAIPPAIFQPASPFTITNTIYGYYVVLTGTPDVLIGAELLSSPVPMADITDQLIVASLVGVADPLAAGVIY